MAYIPKLKQNGWTKKFWTTRDRFLGNFHTRKALDHIFFSQSLLTWRVATNANEADLGNLFSTQVSKFLQSILTKSLLSDVILFALSSPVTGIDACAIKNKRYS